MGTLSYLLLVALTVSRVRSEYDRTCPRGCSCALTAECNALGWTSVPHNFSGKFDAVYIFNNNLTEMDENYIINTGIEDVDTLFLDNNTISEIKPGAFNGLHWLYTISLDGNNLTYLHPNTFPDSLMFLSLSYNPIVLPSNGPFLNNPHLTDLLFNHCNISRLPDDIFINTTSLNYLSLHGNNIDVLTTTTFYRTPNLTILYIGRNQLDSLDPIFMFITNLFLRKLQTKMLSLPHLNPFSIMTNLEYLRLDSNGITILPEDIFENLFKLVEVELSSNLIQRIPPRVFKNNIYITEIDISRNPLILPNNITFLYSLSLTKLDMSYCNINHLFSETFKGLPNLEEIHLIGNNFRILKSNMFDYLLKMKTLMLSEKVLYCNGDLEEISAWSLENNVTLYTDTVPAFYCHDNSVI